MLVRAFWAGPESPWSRTRVQVNSGFLIGRSIELLGVGAPISNKRCAPLASDTDKLWQTISHSWLYRVVTSIAQLDLVSGRSKNIIHDELSQRRPFLTSCILPQERPCLNVSLTSQVVYNTV